VTSDLVGNARYTNMLLQLNYYTCYCMFLEIHCVSNHIPEAQSEMCLDDSNFVRP